MAKMQALPVEILNAVLEYLVVLIGIQKAVLLRTVSRAFDSAILHAICVTQVVDIDDPATPRLGVRMHPSLRGKIVAAKSRSAERIGGNYLSVVAKVNSVLDEMIGESSPELSRFRHDSIAGAVNIECNDQVDGRVEALNLLCGAAIIGDTSVLDKLFAGRASLLASIDVNASTPYFHHALTLAAARGHFAAVQYLLNCGARLDSVVKCWHRPYAPQEPDELADWNRYADYVQSRALRRKPPSALRAAVRGGHGDVVRLLLRPQYRLDTKSIEYLRAILAGIWSGRLDFIMDLFQVIGKDLSEFRGLGGEMLLVAVRCHRKEIVQWLLDKGVEVNAYPGHYQWDGVVEAAACSGDTSMVQFLIERGAVVNLNMRDKFGYTPIEAASECGQKEVVELLIEHGANPVKALSRAARGGQARLVKSLLDMFPDLPFRDGGEVARSAMCCALIAGNPTIISTLVEAGVSLNDGYKCSTHLPLYVAKDYEMPWVVSHLISLGAHDTNEAKSKRWLDPNRACRGVIISERTWEWVGKY